MKTSSDQEMRPRRASLAVLLAMLGTGVGQLYNGQVLKGALFLASGLVVLILSVVLGLFSSVQGLIAVLLIALGLWFFWVIDAIVVARRSGHYVLKRYNRWYIYLLVIAAVNLGIPPLAKRLIHINFQAFRISSSSMYPTLKRGDYLFVKKGYYRKHQIRRGDIVMLEHPEAPSKRLIKRVIGTPGDRLAILDGKVYVDYQALYEPYAHFSGEAVPGHTDKGDILAKGIIVPKDSLFVMGDNRNNSLDSRHWGPIQRSLIKGKPLYTYFSFSTEELRISWDRIGVPIE